MIPPVEVPATTSNSSATGLPVHRSISSSTIAGMIPRMPPPSMERILVTSSFDMLRPRWSGARDIALLAVQALGERAGRVGAEAPHLARYRVGHGLGRRQ